MLLSELAAVSPPGWQPAEEPGSCFFSALKFMSPGWEDFCRWWGKMNCVRRDASFFGLCLRGNDEKHLGPMKMSSPGLCLLNSVNARICHQGNPEGVTLSWKPNGVSNTSSLESAFGESTVKEKKGNLSTLGNELINRIRKWDHKWSSEMLC